jgi:hypothetical protein
MTSPWSTPLERAAMAGWGQQCVSRCAALDYHKEISMMLNMVFVAAFVSVAFYLIAFFRFARRFPRRFPELWTRLGCPESLGLHGQATYLTVVLGLESRVPSHALRQVRGEMVAIRVMLAITVVAFTVVALMTG